MFKQLILSNMQLAVGAVEIGIIVLAVAVVVFTVVYNIRRRKTGGCGGGCSGCSGCPSDTGKDKKGQ